jgi:hypothetical protein
MRITKVLFLVAVSGCAMDEAGDEAGGAGAGGKADGTAPQLATTYALELTSKMRTEDRRESDPAKRFAELSMRARAQVKVTQTGGDVKLAVDICDVRLPVVSGYQPELDAAFVAALPSLQVIGTIEGEEPELVTSPVALVLGAALANPLDDALPAATSSRVKDQDRDGNPGVSIEIPGYGSIFASLRVKLAFSAPAGNVASLSGAADVTLDQKIYGDNIWFYDAASSAAEAEQYVSVVSSSNRVNMKANATTCAKVRQLFP